MIRLIFEIGKELNTKLSSVTYMQNKLRRIRPKYFLKLSQSKLLTIKTTEAKPTEYFLTKNE